MMFPSRSRMSWLPGTVSVENAGEARHNRERKKEHRKRDWGASRKSILMDLVQERRAQKPTGSKWDLINPTGPLLEVVDVRAETTVEGRCILMRGPV